MKMKALCYLLSVAGGAGVIVCLSLLVGDSKGIRQDAAIGAFGALCGTIAQDVWAWRKKRKKGAA